MREETTTADRVAAFSDAVFAVIVTLNGVGSPMRGPSLSPVRPNVVG
jgi:hypothetical protein